MKFKTLTAAVALLAFASTAQAATFRQTGTYGDWITLAGMSNDGGTAMCVAFLEGGQRGFAVKYQKTQNILAIELVKDGWKIPEGKEVNIVIQVDQAPTIKLTAAAFHNETDGKDHLEADIEANDYWGETGKLMIGEILSLIGDGKTVRISFPDGNEKPWEGSLNGSRAAMEALTQCMEALSSKTPKQAPTQPLSESAAPAGATEIALISHDGGSHYVDGTVNGSAVRFVLDTGAEITSIPLSFAQQLVKQGRLRKADVQGVARFGMANGSTSKELVVTLDSVTIGGHTVHNVAASISPTRSRPLLGQTFLQHFGSCTIDNRRNVLILG